MKRRWTAVVLAFLLMALPIAVMLPGTAFAAASASNGKIINVVYDDSKSMYNNNETRWCQAKYAMEVFCAMLGEKDTMNIYSLSHSDVLTVRGSDPQRVEKVHAMNSRYGGTPIEPLRRAGKDICSEDPSFERWFVVLTDGIFEGASVSDIQSNLDSYNAAGVRTVYLAIGSNSVGMENKPAAGGFSETAGSSTEILSKVTSIANQIFDHQVLGSRSVKTSGDKTVLDIDIPTDQIVVFAQGADAKAGDLSLNGRPVSPTSSFNVRHSGDVMPLNAERDSSGRYYDPAFHNAEIVVDTSLNGVVVTYDAGSAPFESGQFSLSVSGASTVEYYYRPGVTVNCELKLNGKEVKADDKLYAGNYEVAMTFMDPLTGKAVESDLLSEAEFTLSVDNNGTVQTLSEKRGTLTLTEGDVDISAVASLPGNVFLESDRSYRVLPEPVELRLDLDQKKAEYTPDRLGKNAKPIILKAVNNGTGQPISKEEWDQTAIRADEFGGVQWDIVKGTDPGTWELRPVSKDGTITSVVPGEYDLDISASYEINEKVGYGSAPLKMIIGEYGGNVLEVSISEPSGNYDLNNMSDPESMTVEIRYEDPVTGKLFPLTEEMWNSFNVTAESQEKIDWKIEKGKDVGTYQLTPGFYKGDPLRTASGPAEVTVTAEGTSEIYSFSGSGSRKAEFEKLTRCNIFRIILPRIVAIVITLWLLIGYLKKKRFRTRGLNPRCRFKGAESPKRKIDKDILSVILPYVPEKATVRCHNSSFQCNFPDLRIVATGRSSFKVLNKTFPLKTTKICGEYYPDMETVHARVFSSGSFDLISIDQRTKKNLGTFSFK